MVAVGLLNPAPYNPRRKLRRGDAEYDDIATSLREFGMVQNLVWNKTTGNLVGGHQRLTVAINEFKATEMPCVVVELDEAREKQLNVMLNRVGQGLWDIAKLGKLMQELDGATPVDVYALGFSSAEVDELLQRKEKAPKKDADSDVMIPKVAHTREGDLYHFVSADGDVQHWLLCGDSTDPVQVERAMAGHRARLLFTDPPYGVDYDNSQRSDGRKDRGKISNDALAAMGLTDFLTRAFRAALPATAPVCGAYVFHASRTHVEFETALKAAGWQVKQQLIWTKHLALSRSDYHWAHEQCLYACKEGQGTPWFGDRTQTTVFYDERPNFEGMKKEELVSLLRELHQASTVWEEKRDPSSEYIHPTQKPTALARRAMKNSTLPRDHVLDLFGGSGSTLIAAEIDGRCAHLLELSPQFCDAIVRRYFETFEDVVVTKNGEEVSPVTYCI